VQKLLQHLDSFSAAQPANPAAALVLAFLRAPCQTGQWLAGQLRALEAAVPDSWRPGLLRELAGICIRDDVADYEGGCCDERKMEVWFWGRVRVQGCKQHARHLVNAASTWHAVPLEHT
jgi:hypothetical protein